MLNIKNFKKISLAFISIFLLSTLVTAKVLADPDSCSHIITIEKLENKSVDVYIKGNGGSEMLIVGPGDIFRNDLLPKELFELFTVYFVDFFRYTKKIDVSKLTMDDFVETVEEIRKKLELDKPTLFAHSALAQTVIAYSDKYPENIKNMILVSPSPFYTTDLYELRREFFEKDASLEKQEMFKKDKGDLETLGNNATFVDNYNSEQTWNFHNPKTFPIERVWGLTDYRYLVGHYFINVVSEVDLREDKYDIKVPTFVAIGRYDYTHPSVFWSDEIFNKYPSITTYHVFEDSAHWSMIEEEELFMKKLKAFLSEEG